jgi:hypothetical protein
LGGSWQLPSFARSSEEATVPERKCSKSMIESQECRHSGRASSLSNKSFQKNELRSGFKGLSGKPKLKTISTNVAFQ